ncbi:MAG TPA: hypothetical protein VHL31_11555 [Geminicoccus sp.]|jgi:chromosome segregation ATPase|uniref:hypothetical protein n=1 Tax=Geminicoccus sp. TaxID=2024832 RepID=UPI002E35F1FB|nr:hypothetical protein [Geminicoccus sp.]HEX2526915.1 hypothetical protein [Geminicoccus sp.]
MTSVTLPASLATAIKQAEDLEARISRTQAALAAAADRLERAGSELAQAEIERDALAAARDLALAAIEMGEQPEEDVPSIEKKLATLTKRATAARAEKETAAGTERGLRARLAREVAERVELASRIEDAQKDAWIALRDAAELVFDEIAELIAARLGPIVAAEAAVGGHHVRSNLRAVMLPSRGGDHPVRHYLVQAAIQKTAPPAAFQDAGAIIRRLARPIEQDKAA